MLTTVTDRPKHQKNIPSLAMILELSISSKHVISQLEFDEGPTTLYTRFWALVRPISWFQNHITTDQHGELYPQTDYPSSTKAMSIFSVATYNYTINAAPYLHGIHEPFSLPWKRLYQPCSLVNVWLRVCTSLTPRPTTMVFGLGTRLLVCIRSEIGVLRNGRTAAGQCCEQTGVNLKLWRCWVVVVVRAVVVSISFGLKLWWILEPLDKVVWTTNLPEG